MNANSVKRRKGSEEEAPSSLSENETNATSYKDVVTLPAALTCAALLSIVLFFVFIRVTAAPPPPQKFSGTWEVLWHAPQLSGRSVLTLSPISGYGGIHGSTRRVDRDGRCVSGYTLNRTRHTLSLCVSSTSLTHSNPCFAMRSIALFMLNYALFSIHQVLPLRQQQFSLEGAGWYHISCG